MLYIIRDILIILLVIIGLVDVVRTVILFFMNYKGKNEIMVIVPIKGHNEEAEIMLRNAATRIRWYGGGCFQKVICLDCGMDEETKNVCKNMCSEFPFIEIKNGI